MLEPQIVERWSNYQREFTRAIATFRTEASGHDGEVGACLLTAANKLHQANNAITRAMLAATESKPRPNKRRKS